MREDELQQNENAAPSLLHSKSSSTLFSSVRRSSHTFGAASQGLDPRVQVRRLHATAVRSNIPDYVFAVSQARCRLQSSILTERSFHRFQKR